MIALNLCHHLHSYPVALTGPLSFAICLAYSFLESAQLGLCESPLVGSLLDIATSYSMPPLYPSIQLLSKALYSAGWWLPAVLAVIY